MSRALLSYNLWALPFAGLRYVHIVDGKPAASEEARFLLGRSCRSMTFSQLLS